MKSERRIYEKSTKSSASVRNKLAAFGIAGPIVYAAVVLTLGAITPGYDHATHIMSELGADGAPNAAVMRIFGFGFLGISIIIFARIFDKTLAKCGMSYVGSILLALCGVSLLLAGFFACDPGCAGITTASRLHNIAATAAGVFASVSLLALYPRMQSDQKFKRYAIFTLVTAILTAAIGISFLTYKGPEIGFLQRATMALPLLWMVTVSARMLRG